MIYGKYPDIWKLNHTLVNSLQIKEEIIKEIRKYSELNENESTKYKNVCYLTNAVLRVKFIVLNAYT